MKKAQTNTKASKGKQPTKRVKDLQPSDARAIRGGAIDIFAKIGDIKGESRR